MVDDSGNKERIEQTYLKAMKLADTNIEKLEAKLARDRKRFRRGCIISAVALAAFLYGWMAYDL